MYPCVEFLLTMEEYETLTPYDKGLCQYMQSSWDESQLSETDNPYTPGTKDWEEFKKGSHAGMIMAQDSEE